MKRLPILMLIAAVLTACTHSRQVHRKSNLMAYLYPEASAPPPTDPGGARLQLPLRIGVAFVPPDPPKTRWTPAVQTILPPDGEKRLVDIVRKSFQGRDWVSQIVTIPSSYLVARGGFENLQQVAQLMNVDVIALVSVDQMQSSDPRRLSFLYISIIGAYVLPLDRNETRTLIDAAVFHVPTRTFLLRAPGVSNITGSSSAVDVESKLRERSVKGFEMAMADLSKNLDAEVGAFKASVASGERQDVDIVTREGKSVRSGGAFGFGELALLALAAGLGARRKARR
ncbi:MAG TPA: rhombotarget lipoprotein [Thermoanaerobaculia bacterium]|nr:rhombotarget lipoprotein [Thermoanaerobaculia bacterium]